MKSSRGAMGVRTASIVSVLEKAGWEARKGRGDHTVLSKPGQRQIVLADRITMAQWKNIERSVGVQVETLLNRSYRGKGLTEAELAKRLDIAHGLWKAGLSASYVTSHAGLVNYKTLPGFTPKLFDTLGVEGVLQQYAPNLKHNAAPQPVQPIEVAQPIAAPAENPAIDTILDLMQGVVLDVRQIIGQRQLRNRNFLSAVRRLVTLRQHIDQECEALLNEMEAAWNEEAEG